MRRKHLQKTSERPIVPVLPQRKTKRRSGCPVSLSLELFGDRWSLLIIRDLMVRGHVYFGDFLHSGEGIASNVLSERLHRLQAADVITSEQASSDARRVRYRLTEKGIDLAPLMFDLLLWGARHEIGAPAALSAQMEKNRTEIISETRRRWRDRDRTPLVPSFTHEVVRSLIKKRRVDEQGPSLSRHA